jgi:hypothetical protein
MPLLKKFVKDEENKKKKPEWIRLDHTLKTVLKNDFYILGHDEVKMPAIVATSTVKGIKARLVTAKKGMTTTSAPPSDKDMAEDNVTIIRDWVFDEANQTIPIYFSPSVQMDSTFWIEMCNPTDQDAVVNALVHGMIRSRGI